jgi:hypothetical protein
MVPVEHRLFTVNLRHAKAKGSVLLLACALLICGSSQLGFGQHFIERRPTKHPAICYNRIDTRGVSNIQERICIEQDKVRDLAFANRAEIRVASEKERGVDCRRSQGGCGR